jgi:hypothetical protein
MAHEIVPTVFPQIKFSENVSGVPHRAIVRSSLVEEDALVIATRFTKRTKGATSAIIYLDTEDVTALRDFLTDWLRKQRRKDV